VNIKCNRIKSSQFVYIDFFLLCRNGQKYSGEVHFVHTNAAATQNAVLAIFMQSSPSKNFNDSESNESERRRRKRRTKREIYSTNNSTFLEWERYFAVGDELNGTNDSTVISLNLATLMGSNLENFYRYSGSLTTPPCTENVIWTVFQTPVAFTEFQLASFRSQLYFEDFRGPQPIYGRTVYRNFPNATLSPISDYACCEENREIEQTTQLSGGSNDENSMLLMNKQLFTYFYLFIFSFLI
jgi:carbonic anhydrase